ncbi:MAG: hypothetical protein WCK17_13435 [Verrucomicrobiota bacterium]
MIFLPSIAFVDGLKFPLSDLPIPRRKKRHLARGEYEIPERNLIKRFVKPGMKVLELGASLGIVSTFIARQIGPDGTLISVEADASLATHWHHNLNINGYTGKCIHALACPIWSVQIPDSILCQSFTPNSDKLSGRIKKSDVACARTAWKTCSEVCSDHQFFPDALIIDIEGTEIVWTEVSAIFPSHIKLTIVEFHPQYTGPEKAAQCVQSLIDQGFRVIGYQNHVMAFAR